MLKSNLIAMIRAGQSICVAAIVLFAGAAQAQSGSFGFDGRIIVPDPHFDYPPIQIRLLIDDFDGRTIAFTYTEGTGSFAFKGLAEGTYYVAVHLDGYQDVIQRVDMTSRVGFNLRGVNILLKPKVPEPDVSAALTRENKLAIDAYGKAINERARGHFEAAAKLLESALMLVPEYPDAHLELGEVYLELHRRVDAEKEFRTAHELSPESLRALLDLGRLYLEEADVQLATGASPNSIRPLLARTHELLSEAVIRNPNSAMAGYLLGTANFRSGSYDNAESELNRALSLDKGMFPARIMLVNVYVVQQKWQNALNTLDKFIVENPSSPYVQEARTIRTSVARRLSAIP
jgi:cytochrome c-type biogenesis protein CcmH/NrfG